MTILKLIRIGYSQMERKDLQLDLANMDPAMKQALMEAAQAEAQEQFSNDQKKGELDQFLSATKERFDKYFDTMGYVCILFDKSNPENQYLASVSNVPFKGFMGKLIKYVAQYKKNLKHLGKLKLIKR